MEFAVSSCLCFPHAEIRGMYHLLGLVAYFLKCYIFIYFVCMRVFGGAGVQVWVQGCGCESTMACR